MRVKQLCIYPVKSMAGSFVTEAQLEPRGFKDDRRWMLVDEEGKFISQREYPSLALWQPTIEGGSLLLTHKNSGLSLVVSNARTTTGPMVDVEVWGTNFQARQVEMKDLSSFQLQLGIVARLVYMSDDSHRLIKPKYAKKGEEVSFADDQPYMIANTASLKLLSDRLSEDLDIRRFRPNIVVEHDVAFSEDDWKEAVIGGQNFRIPKPCGRCIMITIDPETTEKNPAVIAELAKFRKFNNKILFGAYAIWQPSSEATAVLKVDDSVNITERT